MEYYRKRYDVSRRVVQPLTLLTVCKSPLFPHYIRIFECFYPIYMFYKLLDRRTTCFQSYGRTVWNRSGAGEVNVAVLLLGGGVLCHGFAPVTIKVSMFRSHEVPRRTPCLP